MTIVRRPLAQVRQDAEDFRALFRENFDRWEIAGSVRRKRPDVGDCEHVVIPRIISIPSGMFGEPLLVNGVWLVLDELLARDVVKKHVYETARGDQFRWGNKYRGVDFRGFNHEIFLAEVRNWGSVLAIRTGPAEFSKELVIRLMRYGHRNRDGCVVRMDTGEIEPCPEEAVMFGMAGMAYIEPENRKEN